MKPLSAILALGLAVASQSALSATDPVFGRWLSENKRAVIEFVPCGDSACGRMVWLRNPVDSTGRPKTASGGEPLCGFAIAGGFRNGGDGRWEDGEIRNPRDGKVYSAMLRYTEDGLLEVRGYAGLPLFGSTQIWTPAPGYLADCRMGRAQAAQP